MEEFALKIKRTALQFGGFSLVGAATTLVGIAVLFVLNEWLHWNVYIAYVSTYALSILLSYYLNGRYVFKRTLSGFGLVLFYLAYLSGMLFGVGVLYVYNLLLPGWNQTLLSVLVIPWTMFWNFLFVKKIMNRS